MTYFNYSEGFLAISAVVLSCADKNVQCSLPNCVVSDPLLQLLV